MTENELKRGRQYLLWGKYLAQYIGSRENGLSGTEYVFGFETNNGFANLVQADLQKIRTLNAT